MRRIEVFKSTEHYNQAKKLNDWLDHHLKVVNVVIWMIAMGSAGLMIVFGPHLWGLNIQMHKNKLCFRWYVV